ncbi:MAG: hypothetical protein CM15mP62_05060 [Rhodospirillaceae bacterium]|nr:MAG: hypothetical protein CM15mP62_05060 [Rhodospirillaceae bacterium]
MTTPNIFLYVQNLLGIGHLRRAAAISRALTEIGLDVNFVSGGIPIPNLNVGSASFINSHPYDHLTGILNYWSMKLVKIDDKWRQNRCSKLA